jgi:hypothetical protein
MKDFLEFQSGAKKRKKDKKWTKKDNFLANGKSLIQFAVYLWVKIPIIDVF